MENKTVNLFVKINLSDDQNEFDGYWEFKKALTSIVKHIKGVKSVVVEQEKLAKSSVIAAKKALREALINLDELDETFDDPRISELLPVELAAKEGFIEQLEGFIGERLREAQNGASDVACSELAAKPREGGLEAPGVTSVDPAAGFGTYSGLPVKSGGTKFNLKNATPQGLVDEE